MSTVHLLSGASGSAEQERQYASYFATVAEMLPGRNSPQTRSYGLHPSVGRGTIDVTTLRGGFRLVRYDVTFAEDHQVEYRFPSDRFELEACIDGSLRISEDFAGQDDLSRGSVSLTPPRATGGRLIHPAGQPYRGLSLTGCRNTLKPYLGSVGTEVFNDALDRLANAHGEDLYLGRGRRLASVSTTLVGLYGMRADSAANTLMIESRVMTAFADLIHAATERATDHDLHPHEVAALERIPAILWRTRHEIPTVADVAATVSMSPKRLSRGFKTLYGQSPMAYHRQRCLERAAELLVTTDWTVDRIGADVGYASASNFIYAFRRRHGCTPRSYRAERQRGA
ncbi:helix-turn-helix transcriptional regulator [Gordonia malaquae]|uniref:helix-turn-helix domain-containing protein n=1 Tax=Gordonia malaquae TaxID=410332 RepID=UPI00301804DD